MENKMAERFSALIEHLLKNAPEENNESFMCQVTLLTGMMASGDLFRGPVEGVYGFRTLMRKGDQRSGAVEMVDMFFTADAIQSLTMPVAQEEKSGLITASGDPVVPRPRMS